MRLHTILDPGLARGLMLDDIRSGLSARPKTLPCKYFYDDRGADLFERITETSEYYLTRAETEILRRIAPTLVQALRPAEVVELGSGSSTKTRLLLGQIATLGAPFTYLPLDINEDLLLESANALAQAYPQLSVDGWVGSFEQDLGELPPPQGRRLVLFLGSTIGNLDEPARAAFLCAVDSMLGPGDRLLLGLDLVKDPALLEAAYNDAAGLTADFNRNLLHIVNRALDGAFRPETFTHQAFYNRAAARIEMHLRSQRDQSVPLRALELSVSFRAGESIWTESCYKFTRERAKAMLAKAHLRLHAWHTDAEERFALVEAARA